MRRALLALSLIVAVLVAYLLLWPVPVQSVPWAVSPTPGYTGPHAMNNRLAGLASISLGTDRGPEHIVARDGWLYVAVESGAIVRLRPDGSGRELVVQTGGRPLGFDFDAEGALLIADPMAGAHGGLLRATGLGAGAKVELLTDTVDGSPILYADGVVVAKTGKVYFTDASQRFGAKAQGGTFHASVLDIVEHQATAACSSTTRPPAPPVCCCPTCASPTGSRSAPTSSSSSSTRPASTASGRCPWPPAARVRASPGLRPRCCWPTCPATPTT